MQAKIAMQAKRSMAENGMMDESTKAAVSATKQRFLMDESTKAAVSATKQRFLMSKLSRAQVGVELHEVWIKDIKDIAKTCGA